MRRNRTVGAVAVTLSLLAGCGGTSSADAVAWTDDVCRALVGFASAVSTQPDLVQTDPVAAMRGLGDYFGTTATTLDEAIRGLGSAGPAPVDGGDEFVAKLTGTLTQIRTSFEDAANLVANVDTSSVASVAAALPAVVAPLEGLRNVTDPTAGLQDTEALRKAAEQAPNCQRLRAS